MRIAYVGLDLMLPALDALVSAGATIERIFTCNVDNTYEFNTGIIARAKELGIPYTTEKITGDDVKKLRDSGCDCLICGAYYHKIPTVENFPMVNIHPALLPVGRGAWPMPVTILRGLTESGVTIHKITDAFDAGDVLLQRRFAVDREDDLEVFTEKFRSLLPEMMTTLVQDFDALWQKAVPQTEGEYFPNPTDADATITDHMSADTCDRVLRAFYGFPCFYKNYTIIRGRFTTNRTEGSIPACGGYITAERIERTEL